jgi:hypothetical protein
VDHGIPGKLSWKQWKYLNEETSIVICFLGVLTTKNGLKGWSVSICCCGFWREELLIFGIIEKEISKLDMLHVINSSTISASDSDKMLPRKEEYG